MSDFKNDRQLLQSIAARNTAPSYRLRLPVPKPPVDNPNLIQRLARAVWGFL